MQTAAGRAAHHTVSPRTTSVRRHGHSHRHGRSRCHRGNRRHAVTHDLDVNKQRCDNVKAYYCTSFLIPSTVYYLIICIYLLLYFFFSFVPLTARARTHVLKNIVAYYDRRRNHRSTPKPLRACPERGFHHALQ